MFDSPALVTGANRGVGRAFVAALLDRGCPTVYAAARDTATLREVVSLAPDRVRPLHLDLLDPASISRAAETAVGVRTVISNAGILRFGGGLEIDASEVVEHFQVNTMGNFHVIRAFTPKLQDLGGGRMVVVGSLQSLASRPGAAAYSVSKAALHALCQSLRPVLAERGVALSCVYPGAIDTDMLKGSDMPKVSAATVAEGTLDAVERGEAEIFPDPDARLLGDVYLDSPRGLQRLFNDTDALRSFLASARGDAEPVIG